MHLMLQLTFTLTNPVAFHAWQARQAPCSSRKGLQNLSVEEPGPVKTRIGPSSLFASFFLLPATRNPTQQMREGPALKL
jgi:hypothetical protein